MQIAYTSIREDRWRCNWWLVRRTYTPGAVLVLILLITHLIHPALLGASGWPWLIGGLSGTILLFLAQIYLLISQNQTFRSSSICRYIVDQTGISCEFTGRILFCEWKKVKDIKVNDRDIYIIGHRQSFYIPKTAWLNRADADEFHDVIRKAIATSRSGSTPIIPEINFKGWIEEGNSDAEERVWPPAPRVR